MSDIPAWIEAGAAVLSVAGAAVSWWRSNLSRKARTAAQAAEERAQRTMEAIQEIAASMKPPALTVEWSEPSVFVLRNNSDEPVTVSGFPDADAFPKLPFSVPVTLAPGTSVTGLALDAWHKLFPAELVLDVDGVTDPVVVPAPSRPPKS